MTGITTTHFALQQRGKKNENPVHLLRIPW